MEIIVGKNSGFCFGVKRAVDGIEEENKRYKNLKCLGHIVHNEVVVKDFEDMGVKFVDSIDEVEDGETLAIRAHGISKEIYEIAAKRNIKLLDYTCPKVEAIHKQIQGAYERGYQIILIGKKTHPEVIGSAGFAKNTIVIESLEEVETLGNYPKVYAIVQTTFSVAKYLEIEKALMEKYENIKCVNSICASTKIRQDECGELSKKVDFMIVIGGKESSNTKKLYEVAISNNENCILIQDEYDKKIEESKKYDIIGIMSGASTPNKTVEKVIEKIQEN